MLPEAYSETTRFFEVEFSISLYRITKGAWKIGDKDLPHATSRWPLKKALLNTGTPTNPQVQRPNPLHLFRACDYAVRVTLIA